MTKTAKAWGLGAIATAAVAGTLYATGVIQSEPPKTDAECLSDLFKASQGMSKQAASNEMGLMALTESPEVKHNVAIYTDCMQKFAEGQTRWSIHVGSVSLTLP